MKNLNSKNMILIAFLVLVLGVLLHLETQSLQDFLTVMGLTLVVGGIFIGQQMYFKYDKNQMKDRIVSVCSLYTIAVLYMWGLSKFIALDLSRMFFQLLLIALILIFDILWRKIRFSTFEKVVVVSSLVVFMFSFFRISSMPRTSFDLYRSALIGQVKYEELKDHMTGNYREEFTEDDFEGIEDLLQQHSLTISQNTIIEYEGGKVLLLRTGGGNLGYPMKISNITLLPEEISSYFRQYPLIMVRDANYPVEDYDDQGVIETRGAFVREATPGQSRNWYTEVVEVFGEVGRLPEDIFAPNGPVTGVGVKGEGYIEVSFFEDWEVEDDLLEEIYNMYHEKAFEKGIEDIPVIFRHRIVE